MASKSSVADRFLGCVPLLCLFVYFLTGAADSAARTHVRGAIFTVVGSLAVVLSLAVGGRSRWSNVILGLGIVLVGLFVVYSHGVLIALGMILIGGSKFVELLSAQKAYERREKPSTPPDVPPLTLREEKRVLAGISADTDEQGAPLEVVLVDSGRKKIGVMRSLRELYEPLDLKLAKDIAEYDGIILQTTTSRREAEFVASQLREQGAVVEIRGHEGMADGDPGNG